MRAMPTIQFGPHGRAIGKPADERLQLGGHAAGHGRLDDDVLQATVLAQQQLQAQARCLNNSAKHFSLPVQLT